MKQQCWNKNLTKDDTPMFTPCVNLSLHHFYTYVLTYVYTIFTLCLPGGVKKNVEFDLAPNVFPLHCAKKYQNWAVLFDSPNFDTF